MSIKAVLFDLDGTLLDTYQDLGNALNNVRAQQALPPLPLNHIKNHISNGANALIKLSFGETLTNEQHQNYRQQLLAHYLENIAQHTIPFKGVTELLEILKNHNLLWGIVTNKPKTYTDALLPHIHFPSTPDVVVSPEDAGIAKPDPAPLVYACNALNIMPNEAIYVGDHLRDIQCGQRAGMPTIAVSYGYIDANDDPKDWAATYNANAASEIWPLIQPHI